MAKNNSTNGGGGNEEQQVLELSIYETNALRAKLGLKPLKVSNPVQENSGSGGDNNGDTEEQLSLSIDESNALREKLGLAPLRTSTATDSNSSSGTAGRKSSEAIHKAAPNVGEEKAIQRRLEQAKLKREIEAGIQKFAAGGATPADDDDDNNNGDGDGVLDWADKMRSSAKTEKQSSSEEVKTKKRKRKQKGGGKQNGKGSSDYNQDDFQDQNIKVSHNTTDFEAGSSTILTLADRSILNEDNDGKEGDGDEDNVLENVNMTEASTIQQNLKKKRMVEMGVGHAGGYAGYDDDEFEELGGSQALILGGGNGKNNDTKKKNKKKKGFQLADAQNLGHDNADEEEKSDLFALMNGQAISLTSGTSTNGLTHQTDYMDVEEDEGPLLDLDNKPDGKKKSKKQRKMEKKLLKKMKKLKKKERKNAKKTKDNDDDSEEEEDNGGSNKDVNDSKAKASSLLEDLEESANNHTKGKTTKRRKRRRTYEDSSDEEGEASNSKQAITKDTDVTMGDAGKTPKDEDFEKQEERKEKFHSIMEKGNKRSQNFFKEETTKGAKTNNTQDSAVNHEEDEDEDDDDAFLNAALSKARRLNRLRVLNDESDMKDTNEAEKNKGANAVVQSIQAMQKGKKGQEGQGENNKATVTFQLDATKEFTRSLRSRTALEERKAVSSATSSSSKLKEAQAVEEKGSDSDQTEMDIDTPKAAEEEKEEEEGQTLEELAEQIQSDPNEEAGFGSTADTMPVGRGLSAVLGMLKHTGEITGKNAGKEELRGRAKDERTYDDYDALDLKKVVKIGRTGLSGKVHEKDIEFANREIKLEYRDEHGRLLTRKEAYRNLCYQFHGHGSSKKNEEKRLKKIEREGAERSNASRQGGGGPGGQDVGTLGALKATQRATGKAFVLHKL